MYLRTQARTFGEHDELLGEGIPFPRFARSPRLPCYLNGPSLIASLESTAEPSSLLLCNESGITAHRELSKFICPARSRRMRPYESPLSIDLLEISFDTYRTTSPSPYAAAREASLPVQRSRTDEHNHRLSPRSEELRHHIVVARVSAATSALSPKPSLRRAGYPPLAPTLPSAPAIHPQRPRYKGTVFMHIVDWHVDLCTSVILCVLSSPV